MANLEPPRGIGEPNSEGSDSHGRFTGAHQQTQGWNSQAMGHEAAPTTLQDDLGNAEDSAAAGAASTKTAKKSAAASEETPNYYYKPRVGQAKAQAAKEIKDAKERSAAYKKGGGRRRGIFIGVGAGGGLISVIAGFTSLLPMKMPGIMDTIIGDAGKRIEKVVERRAERVFLLYILKGSAAAFKTGNVIVTGNPIGDLFANIRTSNFEKQLLANKGLSIEPNESGKGVRLKYEGDYVWAQKDFSNGTIKNSNEIFKLLDEGKTLTRADLRAIVRTEIPAWRFWKRAKFVKWLRIKYNVPRWGARERKAGETDEDYNKSVKQEHITRSTSASLENMSDFVDCAAEAGDCPDRTNEGEKMKEAAEKALTESTEDLAEEGVEKASSTVVKLAITKLLASSVGSSIPYIAPVDITARLMHGVGKIIDGDLLQKKHAAYIKRSSAVLGASYAGYSDQTKAGDMETETVGMYSNNFDGWEDSVSYGVIQSAVTNGAVTGEVLEPMERAEESVDLPTFVDFMKTMFGTVGLIGRAPLEAWYYTVSQAFDFLGSFLGDAVAWIVKHTPAEELLAKLAPLMEGIFTGLMKFIGMYIDPLAVGAKLVMYIHQGFLGSFNDKGKEDGMRKLSESEGLAMDQEIQQDHIADLKNESLYNRLLNMEDSSSLASTLVATMPSSFNNPIATLTTGSMRLVSNAPANLARATTASAYAAPSRTSESYFGLNIYGALPGDLAAELDSSTSDSNKKCPPISDKAFNHCIVDKSVVESMKCTFVKCADMYENQASNGEKDYLFSYGTEGPLYGPDAVRPKQNSSTFAFGDWVKANGAIIGSLLPVAALEVSRRRLQ